MGAQVLPVMEALVARARSMAEIVVDLRTGAQGSLRVGVATDMGKLILAPLIHAFNEAQPGIALDVQTGGFQAMAELLQQDGLDALVCYDDSALTAGELCGASAGGAWVACRTPLPEGGVRCAAVGRYRQIPADARAIFSLGADRQEASLERILIPGVGSVFLAYADFPPGRFDDPFAVTFAGIEARRHP